MNSVKDIASRFAIEGAVADAQPLKIGHINDSYIIATEGGKKYFLQRINTAIFRDPEQLQRNIQLVTSHLRKKLAAEGVADTASRVLRIIPADDGKLWLEDADGNAWRMYAFIPGSHSLDDITPATAYLAGKAFGEFQNMLADIDVSELAETIPNFHNIEFRLEELNQAIAADKAGRVALPESQAILGEIAKRAHDMCLPERLHRQGKLPKRICHCDAKVNNMLLDAGDKPMAIVDLDTVMPSFVLSDIGDFMRTGANTGAEDDPDLGRVGIDLGIFEAFVKGYLPQAQFLTEQEIELLPFAAKLLAYMQAVRFFTDYLNGDTYYKTAHPGHNLQRTRAQMRLLESIEENYQSLVSIVNKYRK